MIRPTVGRIVHFYDHSFEERANNGMGKGPYAAIITQSPTDEINDSPVRLTVFYPESERTTGRNSIETDVRQQEEPNLDAKIGRYWVVPSRV